MKTKKRFLAVVLAAALLVAGLTGCKDALRGVAQKISGSSGEVQEEDTNPLGGRYRRPADHSGHCGRFGKV